jgi:cytochrome c peroxidase
MKRLWIVLVGLVLVFGLVACQKTKEEQAATEEKPAAGEEVKEEAKEEEVKEEAGEESAKETKAEDTAAAALAAGKLLFNDVGLGTTGKSCDSCHAGGKGLEGVGAKYSGEGKLTAVINNCIKNPLKGSPLDEHGEKMKNLAAYVSSL